MEELYGSERRRDQWWNQVRTKEGDYLGPLS